MRRDTHGDIVTSPELNKLRVEKSNTLHVFRNLENSNFNLLQDKSLISSQTHCNEFGVKYVSG